MTRWEWLFALMAVTGMGTAAYESYQLHQQTRRADAFQDALNEKIWARKVKCRVEAAKQTQLMRALAADAMAAEHEAHQARMVLEGLDEE